jgi:hypothetical protein
MRILGDSYVKNEFRAHRDVENPLHIVRPCPSCLDGQGWNQVRRCLLRLADRLLDGVAAVRAEAGG